MKWTLVGLNVFACLVNIWIATYFPSGFVWVNWICVGGSAVVAIFLAFFWQ